MKLAKRMKKNNISIDFIAFGELEGENTTKLAAFNENVKGGEGSHLAIIPPGPHLLSDALLTTPILGGEAVAGEAGGGTGASDPAEGAAGSFEFGVDPSRDPELALALRMSFEEERARLDKEKREREAGGEARTNLEGIPEEGDPKPPAGTDDAKDGGGGGGGGGETSGDPDGKGDEGDGMNTT